MSNPMSSRTLRDPNTNKRNKPPARSNTGRPNPNPSGSTGVLQTIPEARRETDTPSPDRSASLRGARDNTGTPREYSNPEHHEYPYPVLVPQGLHQGQQAQQVDRSRSLTSRRTPANQSESPASSSTAAAAAAGRAAYAGTQKRKPVLPMLQTQNFPFQTQGPESLPSYQGMSSSYIPSAHPYQPAAVVNEGNLPMQPAAASSQSDSQTLRSRIMPRRRDDYQDDAAIRRQENRGGMPEDRRGREMRPGTTRPPRASPEPRQSSESVPDSPRSGRGSIRSFTETIRELSPKRNPKVAAALEDPFAALKKSSAKRKARKEDAEREAAIARANAERWARPPTPGPSSASQNPRHRHGQRKDERKRAEIKAKISNPIDTGNVFQADRIPAANQQALQSMPRTKELRPAPILAAPPPLPPPPVEMYSQGPSESRITRIGDFIDAGKGKKAARGGSGSVTRQSSRGREASAERGPSEYRAHRRKPSVTSLFRHRPRQSDESSLDFECAGLEETSEILEDPTKRCLICGAPNAMEESGLCLVCRDEAGIETGKFFKRSSSIYTIRHSRRASFYSDPENPLIDSIADSTCLARGNSDPSPVGDTSYRIRDLMEEDSRDSESPLAFISDWLIASSASAGIGVDGFRDTAFYGFYDDILDSPVPLASAFG